MNEQTRTNHEHLVELSELRRRKDNINLVVLSDGQNYYLIKDILDNGEFYPGTPCDEFGWTEDEAKDVEIWPVDDWDEDDNFDLIGYRFSRPEYPEESRIMLARIRGEE